MYEQHEHGWLWNELEKPGRALPLLKTLAQKKKPDKNWLLLVAVYNTLQQYADAAMTFERVIEIDPAPDYLYNCGVLWLQADKPDKALKSLLRLADATPPKADWFVAMAQAWLIKEQIPKAADAMERAASISKKPQHIHQAGVLRIQLKQADRAIALLTPLAGLPKPKSEWLVALANAWLLKENYLKGATYMEQAAVISGKGKLFHRAAMLWRVEGNIPKTVTLLRKSVSGKTPEHMESLGDIYYALHRYGESCTAYERAATLSGDPNPDARMKAAYAAMKDKQYSRAADNFEAVVSSGAGEESQIRSASQNLAYIEKLRERGNSRD
ncbi:hypothetical protein DSCO28_59910 [Desulfosarcina ovata subsp. sediminis]|uniref:Tetratricopeptide repeat protein n=1 Tax=Desulfosarcina ovata subsp. sediminis TaxID=885957 RepID=A0A5K7ZYS5_9BACT|nr:tetratricopeptide repeat protein [Desulfosarcina ovata]BBO85425.1 hypothetical protein DSCO28_59910 [Desulfosarcina ovata subsp. sediminis]